MFGNAGSGYILDFLRENGGIFGLIDCPRTAFQPGTDTKTNILFFKKKTPDLSNRLKIAVALTCGHDRRGRSLKNDGTPFPDDFALIARDWHSKNDEYCFDSDITNKYYLVPRYYDRKTDLLLTKDAERLDANILTLGEMVSREMVMYKERS